MAAADNDWLLQVYSARAVGLARQGLPVHAAHLGLAALGGATRESLSPRLSLPVQNQMMTGTSRYCTG